MKRTYFIFGIAVLVLLGVMFWMMNNGISGDITEILTVVSIFILVGFALFFGIRRVVSMVRKEPLEDELSKKLMMKASSLSYFISLYLWLFIGYMSDKTALETHTLIGAGIIGMAVVFFLSWIYVKFLGLKNE